MKSAFLHRRVGAQRAWTCAIWGQMGLKKGCIRAYGDDVFKVYGATCHERKRERERERERKKKKKRCTCVRRFRFLKMKVSIGTQRIHGVI